MKTWSGEVDRRVAGEEGRGGKAMARSDSEKKEVEAKPAADRRNARERCARFAELRIDNVEAEIEPKEPMHLRVEAGLLDVGAAQLLGRPGRFSRGFFACALVGRWCG